MKVFKPLLQYKDMQSKKIEEYQYFQPIAWVTVLIFTMFVFALSIQSRNVIKVIQINNATFEQRLQALEKNLNTNDSTFEAVNNIIPQTSQSQEIEEILIDEDVISNVSEVETAPDSAATTNNTGAGGVGGAF